MDSIVAFTFAGLTVAAVALHFSVKEDEEDEQDTSEKRAAKLRREAEKETLKKLRITFFAAYFPALFGNDFMKHIFLPFCHS